MILVAVIDINIVATTGADLNHFVRNILNSEFIVIYTITDKLIWLEAISNVGFFSIKNFKALDSKISVVIIDLKGGVLKLGSFLFYRGLRG